MALLKCHVCANPVSSTADKCPRCGAKVKKKTSGCTMLIAVGLVFVGWFVVDLALKVDARLNAPPPASAPADPQTPDAFEAWEMAKRFVKDELRSPGTADFGERLLTNQQSIRYAVTILPDGTYVVKLWVDSQNGFGATTRTHFIVHMRHKGGGKWGLEEPLTVVDR